MEDVMTKIDRRQFIKTGSLTVAVTSTCLCGFSGCATITKVGDTPAINPKAFSKKGHDLIIDLSKEPVLKKTGGAVKIKDEAASLGIIIARTGDNSFAVASLFCTHRGVEVEYDQKKQEFECASLGSSRYSLEGANKGGPADTPLKKYEAALQDNILTIKM
jgi:Rieske Fe-S protein